MGVTRGSVFKEFHIIIYCAC